MTEGESAIKIGELLVRAGILTGVDLSEAEKLSKHMQLQFGRVLIMSGCLAERDLESALEAQALIRDGMVSADVAVQALHMSSNEQISLHEALEYLNVVPKFGTATLELAELLADAAIISGEVLGETLQESLHTNASLGELLVEKKAMSPSLLPILNSMLGLIRAGELVQADAVEEIRNTYYMWAAADQAVQRDPVAQSPILSAHETPRFVAADQLYQAPPPVPAAPLQMPPVAHSTPGLPNSMEEFMTSFNEFAAQQYSISPTPPQSSQPEYVASYSDQVYQETEAPTPSIFDVLAVFQEKIASDEFGQALESATHLETADALSSFEQAQREPSEQALQAAELRERAYGVTHGGEVSARTGEPATNGASSNAFERLRARQEQSSPPDGGWHPVDDAPTTSDQASGSRPVEESAAPALSDRELSFDREQQVPSVDAEEGFDVGSQPAEPGWPSAEAEPTDEGATAENTEPLQRYASATDYWHIYWDKDEAATPGESEQPGEVAASTEAPTESAQSYETSDYWHIYWDKTESREPASQSVEESEIADGEREESAASDWEGAQEPAAASAGEAAAQSEEEPAEAVGDSEHNNVPDGERDHYEEALNEVESESVGEETFEPEPMNFEKPDDSAAAELSQAQMAPAEKREPIRHPVEYAWTSETGLPSSSIAEPARNVPEKLDRRPAEPSEPVSPLVEEESTLADIFENEEPEQSTFEPTSTVIELLIEASHLQREQIYQAYLRALQDDELSAKLLEVLGLAEKVVIEAASVCATALKEDRLNPDEAIEVLYAIKSGVDANEALAMAELSLPEPPPPVVPLESPAPEPLALPAPAEPPASEPRKRGRKATMSDFSEVEDLSTDQQTGSPQIFETGDFEPIPVRAARSKKARAAADPFSVMKAKKEAAKKEATHKQEITLAKGLDAGASQWELEPIDEAKGAAIEAASKAPQGADAEDEWILAEVPTMDQWTRSDSAKVLDEITPVLDMVPIPEPVVLNFERTSPKNIDIVDEDSAPEPSEPAHRARPGRKYPAKSEERAEEEADVESEEPADSGSSERADVGSEERADHGSSEHTDVGSEERAEPESGEGIVRGERADVGSEDRAEPESGEGIVRGEGPEVGSEERADHGSSEHTDVGSEDRTEPESGEGIVRGERADVGSEDRAEPESGEGIVRGEGPEVGSEERADHGSSKHTDVGSEDRAEPESGEGIVRGEGPAVGSEERAEPNSEEVRPEAAESETWDRPHPAGTDADETSSQTSGEAGALALEQQPSQEGRHASSEVASSGSEDVEPESEEKPEAQEETPEESAEQAQPRFEQESPQASEGEEQPKSEDGDTSENASDDTSSDHTSDEREAGTDQAISMLDDEVQSEPALATVGSSTASTAKDHKGKATKKKPAATNAPPQSDSTKKVPDKKKPLKNRKKK